VLAEPAGLVTRLDELAREGRYRLRLHRRNIDERPGPILARLIPDETPFDPDDTRSMEQMLPEPGVWLDRLIREPVMLVSHALRRLRKARKARKARKLLAAG
jgi:hypothetical protein